MNAYIYTRVLLLVLCAVGTAPVALSQTRSEVLAIVNGNPITTTNLKPFLPPNFESFAPDKALAVQKVALENAVIGFVLMTEARRRGISVSALRKQMTAGPVRVPDSRVAEEWMRNARHFGLMSPDEAKERLRLDLEAEERMKLYKSSLARLKKAAKIALRFDRLVEPQVKLNGPVLLGGIRMPR